MTDDTFDIVERDYDDCKREEYPRQIKTRKSSYDSILQKFTNYRIKKLNEKLEKMKNSALTEGYSGSNYENKIWKKSEAIARLEEKIMILSKEDVPTNYVQKRAIKLKKGMCENLTYNSQNLYSVGIENKSLIFDEAKEEKSKEEKEELNVNSDELDRKTIEESINAEFSNLNKEEEIEEYNEKSKDGLASKDIEDVINQSFDDIKPIPEINLEEEENKYVENEPIPEVATEQADKPMEEEENKYVENEPIPEVKTEQADKPMEEYKTDNSEVTAIPPEEYENKESDLYKSEEVAEENFENYRVSQNNSSQARTFMYDRYGNDIREYNYVPMTDEEIRASQEKLGFDEHGNLLPRTEDKTERKVGTASIVEPFVSSIVVPSLKLDAPRKEITELTESPVVVNEMNEEGKTIEDYNSLREKILYLKQQKELTRKQREEAQRTAEETAEKAKEVKEMFEESEKNYAQSIDLLRAYQEELEEDCNENIRSTENAENDTRLNTDFITTHQEKMDHNNRIIDEIGSLIGEPRRVR